MKRTIFLGVAITCVISLSACGNADLIWRVHEAESETGYFFPQGTTSNVYKTTFLGYGLHQEEEDALDEDERGWHEFILVDGDRREYHGYSTLVETGYYEHFYWEKGKGKGLVTYESGYGALADDIEMYLAE